MNEAIVGPAVVVLHVQHHRDRGLAGEEDVDVAPEAQVLRPLADVEADLGLALAGVAAVDLDDPVLDRQAGELALRAAGRGTWPRPSSAG